MADCEPRHVGPETFKNHRRREEEGFYKKYLSGDAILDIGFRGGDPNSVPVVANAVGIELDYPGYDGRHLPFKSNSQDCVFASHCLEHIHDYVTVLADWYRVIRTGGYLIVAVPHRDLYERKSTLPSRFNPDHKRFYTPASLLAEIEEALPVGGYRVRSLRDVDDCFNYELAPTQHAQGLYEIEIVIQKIALPSYSNSLRPSSVSAEYMIFCANLLCKAVRALRDGRTTEVNEVADFLARQTLPPFPEIRRLVTLKLKESNDQYNESIAEGLKSILTPIVAMHPFNEDWYINRYLDVAATVEQHGRQYAHLHYVNNGYFEGRSNLPDEPM